MKKLIGAICLGAGIVLLVWGYNISQGINSQFKSAFTGSPTDQAMYRYIAGGILVAIGLVQLLLPNRKKS